MAALESMKLQTPQRSILPPELLELISIKLPAISTKICFRGVCRSWRSAAKSTKLPPHLPLVILLTETKVTSTTCSVFSPYTGTAHSVDLPERAQGHCICASSAGWLVLINRNLDSFLLNPLTRSTIRLPSPAGTFRKALKINHRKDFATLLTYRYLCYAFMASYTENQRECVVAFTKVDSSRFVYCRLGDAKWTEVRADVKCILSFAYLKGKFYIMAMSGVVSVWDVNGEPVKNLMVAPPPLKNFMVNPAMELPLHCYLMATDEDVLMVGRLGNHHSHVESYELYRLDVSEKDLRWVRVRELGDRKVFMVPGVPRAAVVSDAYGCRGNTVYFLSNSIRNGWEIGAFDIENGSVEMLPGHLGECWEMFINFVWFAPRFC